MIAQREVGKNGPAVGCVGYGAMGLEGYYGSSDDEAALKTIQRAMDVGATMIDTADAYGNGHNECLVGRAIENRRNEAFIATKFGIVFDPNEAGTDLSTGWGFSLRINGRPPYVRKALDDSLRRLGVDIIDLWYAHYPDPSTPIEETVGAMATAVSAGKVRYIGLSNVTAEQVRRANSIHRIAAVQYEYSLWRREAETELLPVLRELGITLVSWSPLGAGFLAGALEEEIGNEDFRRNNPRFSGSNFHFNRDRYAPLRGIASELGVTPAQLALAWILHRGEDLIPIPGTRRPERVAENAESGSIRLDEETIKRIDSVARMGAAKGQTLL